MSILTVDALTAGYGRIQVLDRVSVTVEQRQVVGVLGHNGMGKTTLLRALMGFLPATHGRITLSGADITRLPPDARARAGIGYVPQGREIFPTLSVLDNLRMGAVTRGSADRDAIATVLDEFPRLKPLLNRRGGALSGGEQQLLAIARCLCGGPSLILLDEPTEGIQPSIIEEIARHLQRLVARHDVTIVLVEQNLEFVRALAERVLIIQKGRITQEVTPGQLDDPDMVSAVVGITS